AGTRRSTNLVNSMRLHRSLTGIFALALVVGLGSAACSDDDNKTSSTGSDGGGATTGTNSGGSGAATSTGVGGGDACLNDAAQDCSPAEPAHPGAQLDVGTVTATVVDQNGDPAADMVADICGTNICAVYGHTDAAGLFDENAMATPIDDPLLLYGDGITFSK